MTLAENPFAVSIDARTPSTAVVRLSGELDLMGAPELRARLSELLAARLDVIVDLTDLSFIDSTGISVLVGAHKQSAAVGDSFVLRAPSGQIARVLHMTGVDQVFTVEPSD
jgi:anti-sigma B factor antagonist